VTDRFPHDAAPYVLGALDPDDRREFEEHLVGCADCRAQVQGFAGLPGLLSRIPAAEVARAMADDLEPPPQLVPELLEQVRRERRSRRWRAVTVGAVAACLAATAAGVLVGVVGAEPARPPSATGPEQPGAPEATEPTSAEVPFVRVVPAAPATAEATLSDVAAGTLIRMTCRYTGEVDGRQREYVLRVVPKSGPPIRLGAWPVLTGDDYWLGVVAPLPRDRIAAFEVTNATGRVLLKLSV
jgi:anti-sigma-K factor RskA